MKRGFTLVETIISIALIIIVGTGSVVFVVNTNKNNNLEKITKEILEAGSAYIKIEKDENGRVLANEVVKGAKGVKVPVSNLVSRGYLDESIKNELYSLEGNPSSTNDYYVMFVQEGGEYCNENEIKGISSWMEKGKDVYLCDEYGTGGDPGGGEKISLINTIKESNPSVSVINEITTNDYYNRYGASGYGDAVYFSKQNGLYRRDDGTYFYRGNVGNNYVNVFGEIYRIVSFKDNKIRLIKETPIYEGYLNLSKALNTNYPESSVSNAISEYLTNLQLNCHSIITDDISDVEKCLSSFTTDSFCDDQKQVPYEDSMITPSFNCNEDSLNLSAGLISVDEAIFAGVPLTQIDNVCNLFNSSGCYGVPVVGNSYLITGGTTITMNTYKAYNMYSTYGNIFHLVVSTDLYTESHYGTAGVLTNFSAYNYKYESYKQKVSGIIRPVIVLDNNYIKVEGRGTVDSPFKIVFE